MLKSIGLGGNPRRRSNRSVRVLNAKAIVAYRNDRSGTRHRGCRTDHGDGTRNANKRGDIDEKSACASYVTATRHSSDSNGAGTGAGRGSRACTSGIGFEDDSAKCKTIV